MTFVEPTVKQVMDSIVDFLKAFFKFLKGYADFDMDISIEEDAGTPA